MTQDQLWEQYKARGQEHPDFEAFLVAEVTQLARMLESERKTQRQLYAALHDIKQAVNDTVANWPSRHDAS